MGSEMCIRDRYMIGRHEALAMMPTGLDSSEAGPLLCAGITTFNSLRNSGARMGDTVAVQGLGGLGHLGIQFAAKAGYRVVAIGRGSENAALAKKLGAAKYIDSTATKPADGLQKLGGASDTGYGAEREGHVGIGGWTGSGRETTGGGSAV